MVKSLGYHTKSIFQFIMFMMKSLLHYLFIKPTTSVWLQLFRYAFVGGAAFVIDFGTLYFLTEWIGLHHLLSAAVAFLLGLIVNYLLSISWVFSHDRTSKLVNEFAIFAIIGIIGLGINEMIIYLGSDILHLHYLLSKILSTAVVFIWNFFARRRLLFIHS